MPGREKLLRVFMGAPSEEVHLGEAARRAGVSKERAHAYLNEFDRRGFLLKRRQGNLALFRANMEDERLRKQFETYEVEKRLAFEASEVKVGNLCRDFTRAACESLKERVAMVILFGSGARKEMSRASDVDLLVVVWSGKEGCEAAITDAGSRMSMRYGIEVIPLVVTVSEFGEGLQARKEFYRKLWADRVVFHGEAAFIREVGKYGI